MDGTLLDLYFDVKFWRSHLPLRYSERHNISANSAHRRLERLHDDVRDRLQFYCTTYWAQRTGLNIAELMLEVADLIRFRVDASCFLERLRVTGKKRIIVTNAPQDVIDLKHLRTGIGDQVEAIESAHHHGEPKERAKYWHLIVARYGLDPARTLLIDDNIKALQAACAAGIAHLRAVRRPNSLAPVVDTGSFVPIDHFMPIAPDQ